MSSSHRCSSPFCKEPADSAVAFCFRHSAIVPQDELEQVNIAWRKMNRRGSGTAEVSRFYKARQRAIDAAGRRMSANAAADSSGPFRTLFSRLYAHSGADGKPAGEYKGDIASVSRAQDDSYHRSAQQKAWSAKKRSEQSPSSQGG